MGAFIDLTGKTFNRLTVIEKAEKRGKEWYWKCECSCGNEKIVCGSSLRHNRIKSCGCLKKETDKQPKGNVKNEIGNKYGHLTVISRAGSDNRGEALWECECDCPAHNHIIVLGSNLRTSHTQSCGCDRRSHGEIAIEKILTDNNIPFEQEYKAFKFSSGMYAKFDFFINNQYFIEYDGKTHYKYNLHGWHTEEQLKAQQERDLIKNQWCKENNIPLIRIPYTHFNEICIKDLELETSQFII